MFALLVLQAAVGGQWTAYGMGTTSCATAWEQVNQRASAEWALGFWSGKNRERMATVGEITDRAGVLAEVRLQCDAEPSASLVQATARAYDRLQKRNR